MRILKQLANKAGFFSKDQVKEIKRSYAAAAINRLTNGWTTQSSSVDSIARMDLPTLRARSRDLAMNNCYAQKFLTMMKTNVLGESGLQLKNKAKDPPSRQNPNGQLDKYANRIVEERFWEWGKKENCTVAKNMTWTDVQNVSLESIGRDGECLIRKVRGFPNKFGFALQVIESDYLDVEKNEELANGNQVRMGVEFNSWRQPVAYWILKSHPNDFFYNRAAGGRDYYRIPAEEIVHPFSVRRIDQTRGFPLLATVMYQMNMLGKYEEAEVTAARAGASKMGFYTAEEGQTEYTGDTDGQGNFLTDAEPGTFEKLPRGWKVSTVDWNHPNSAYQVFMKTALRGLASGLNVSYNTLANDMESVNFASGKLGIEEERQAWRAMQCWMSDHFANPIFSDWLDNCLLNQTVALPYSKFEKFNQPDWRGRRWDYINPQQEVDAKVKAVRSGMTSIQRVLAERGLDRDEVFEEIKEDQEMAKSLGIELPELEPDPVAGLTQSGTQSQVDE
jgi:lambda family phage portal protein